MATNAAATHGSVPHHPGHDRPGIAKRIIRGIPHFFSSLDRAVQATHDIERLSRLSDTQLLARGLSRADLSRVVFERYFGTPRSE